MNFPEAISELKVIWKKWDIRTFIISSLTFQLILILIAPFRKRTSTSIVRISTWLSYLLADWVAVQAVGLITRATDATEPGYDSVQANLFAFWAQFLLLHLGGPDTITALALQDNELWLRTGLHLGTQAYSTLGILVRCIRGNRLWAPTILMFVAGSIKYLERISSLFNGQLKKVEILPVDYLGQLKPKGFPGMFRRKSHGQEKRVSNYVDTVKDAFCWFSYYKGLYADREFRYEEWLKSRMYFQGKTSKEAYNMLEIELNFAYEAFYTKMLVFHKTTWKIVRHIVILIEIMGIVIWYLCDKQGFQRYDIRITYVLVIAAIATDVLASIRIHLSDWSIGVTKSESRIRSRFYNKLLRAKDPAIWESQRNWSKEEASTRQWLRWAFFRRSSESVSQLSLLSFCMDERSEMMQKMIEFLHVKDLLDQRRYVSKKWLSHNVWDFIFKNLRKKPWGYRHVIQGARENWLSDVMGLPENQNPISEALNGRADYDRILLRWHIVTELCYRSSRHNVAAAGTEEREPTTDILLINVIQRVLQKSGVGENDEEEQVVNSKDYRGICKTLSDYMIYLLIYQSELIYPAGGDPKIEDIISGIKRDYFEEPVTETTSDGITMVVGRNCTGSSSQESTYFGEKTRNSVLPYIRGIIQELKEMEAEKGIEKWEFIAKVWVELLCYAAIRCRANVHAAQLKNGGELLSFVWLSMLHFGFGFRGDTN